MRTSFQAIAFAFALSASACYAQTEEWTCPTTDKVALLARSPGWLSGDTLTNPYRAPAFRFEFMRYSEVSGPGAACYYRVENGGLLYTYKYGVCQVARGTWKLSGTNNDCTSSLPADCSLRCVPK